VGHTSAPANLGSVGLECGSVGVWDGSVGSVGECGTDGKFPLL
jgi:hypothetical protein